MAKGFVMSNQPFRISDTAHTTKHDNNNGALYLLDEVNEARGACTPSATPSKKHFSAKIQAGSAKQQVDGILPSISLFEEPQSPTAITEKPQTAKSPDDGKTATNDSITLPSVGEIRGVNISGGETSTTGWPNNTFWPSEVEFKEYKKLGLTDIRLPISLENMIPKLNSPLNKTEVHELKNVMAYAKEAGVKLIIDLHDYDHYQKDKTVVVKVNGKKEREIQTQSPRAIGPQLTAAELASFWKQIATVVTKDKNSSTVIGYDIMNEPAHDNQWPAKAQAAINAIREVDSSRYIFLEADNYSGSQHWTQIGNELLSVTDPKNKIIYEAHSYWDPDHSNSYGTKGPSETAKEIIAQDVAPFVDWLKPNKEHGQLHGIIGEFETPHTGQSKANLQAWSKVQAQILEYLNENHVGWTAWGGGQDLAKTAQGIDDAKAYVDQLSKYAKEKEA
jgi:aryl-phospho-beta-D-glucosidase BglC (GH1 family)